MFRLILIGFVNFVFAVFCCDPNTEFKCTIESGGSNVCVAKAQVGNGIDNCGDNSDEGKKIIKNK